MLFKKLIWYGKNYFCQALLLKNYEKPELDLKDFVIPIPFSKSNFAFSEDSNSDDDILTVKRKDHELADEEVPLEDLSENTITKKKPVTKVAAAKKILKKKIVANKKTVFNEEGEVLNLILNTVFFITGIGL